MKRITFNSLRLLKQERLVSRKAQISLICASSILLVGDNVLRKICAIKVSDQCGLKINNVVGESSLIFRSKDRRTNKNGSFV